MARTPQQVTLKTSLESLVEQIGGEQNPEQKLTIFRSWIIGLTVSELSADKDRTDEEKSFEPSSPRSSFEKADAEAMLAFEQSDPTAVSTAVGSVVSMALNETRKALTTLLAKPVSTIAQAAGVVNACLQKIQTWLVDNKEGIVNSIKGWSLPTHESNIRMNRHSERCSLLDMMPNFLVLSFHRDLFC